MVDASVERLQGAENVLWDLTVFYASLDDPQLQEDIEHLQEMANDFEHRYRGRIANLEALDLVALMQALEAIYELRGRLGTFGSLQFATNTHDVRIGAFVQRIQEMNAQLGQKMVFFQLEWNALPDAHIDALLSHTALQPYAYYLRSMRRYRDHQLSEAEERILLEKNVTGQNAWQRYFTQVSSGLSFVLDGETLTLSEIMNKLFNPDRAIRQRAAETITTVLDAHEMNFTFIFNTLLAEKASDDRLRGYESWIQARNLANKATSQQVDALIETVMGHYELVQRHYRLKRALMGLDELWEYDRYAPVPGLVDEQVYSWDEARDLVLRAFESFSPQMAAIARRFFDENWIHAPVMQGKRGGAFCSFGTPGTHPFVMMNFMGRPRDVMTLAHELGHGVHAYLANEAQGLFGSHTPLTTAEMASTFAEALVFDLLMAETQDPGAQLALLIDRVEDSFGTIFRQTAMNRFEHGVHTARRQEGELASARIDALWQETQTALYGDSIQLSEGYASWWRYIPHFIHTPGYVYAYAFGELLVYALYERYQQTGAAFVPQYLDLLAAGDSDDPDKLLARLDCDLNDPGFWQTGMAQLAALVEREETLVREHFSERLSS